MEVFDAWEQGKLIMEDGRKYDGVISKILLRDITMNNMDRMIELHDNDLREFTKAILSNEVSIKSSKVANG